MKTLNCRISFSFPTVHRYLLPRKFIHVQTLNTITTVSFVLVVQFQSISPSSTMADNTTSILKCDVCHKPESEQSKLLLCARCKVVKYCSEWFNSVHPHFHLQSPDTHCQSSSWETHKTTCLPQNYINFSLLPNYIKSPSIHRTLSCPAKKSFEMLHHALQAAFGWANVHTYDFRIYDPVFARPVERAPDAEPVDPAMMLAYVMNTEAARTARERGEFGPRKNLLGIVDVESRSTEKNARRKRAIGRDYVEQGTSTPKNT